ncbi:MAG: hypothetical protein AAGI11_04740 [Pseudomonadota bacterium]
MATLSFEVTYSQPDNSSVNGTITFTYEGESGDVSASLPANGRLDQVDDQVSSVGAFPVTLDGAEFDAVVECTRTGVDRMDVKVVFFGNVFEGSDDPTFMGSGYGYGYGSDSAPGPVMSAIIQDVPIKL